MVPPDETEVSRRAYEPPTVRDLGDLAQMTADMHHVTFGIAAQAGTSVPVKPPPPPGGDTPPGGSDFTRSGPSGDVSRGGVESGGPIGFPGSGSEGGGTGGEVATGGAPGGGGTGGTGGTQTVSDAGKLPFTGFPVAVIGAFGGALTATGAWLRRKLRD
jgi:hypothetical protein